MKFSFYPELHIASTQNEDSSTALKVNTLLQNIKQKQPAINAFLGARYSRSIDSITEIAKEVYTSGKDASKRLESIFFGYGHKSVGDMAELFLTLENVPMLVAQRTFYSIPVHAGQERSTRYQNFSKPNFVSLPAEINLSPELKKEYAAIQDNILAKYNELLPKTYQQLKEFHNIEDSEKQAIGALQARAFDTARYLLPLGLRTSLAVVTSARLWSDYIGIWRASSLSVEREMAELIYSLLTYEDPKGEYLPEADALILHTEANPNRKETANAFLTKLQKYLKSAATKLRTLGTSSRFAGEPLKELIYKIALLKNPNFSIDDVKLSDAQLTEISEIIIAAHDHHHGLGNLAQTGHILIEGYTDYGTLKDLVRHRSLERFIPFYEEHYDLISNLAQTKDLFSLCPYLEHENFLELKQEYIEVLNNHYAKVISWLLKAEKTITTDQLNEFGRYLLPHAHNLKYLFAGSLDDLNYTIRLRSRNGGHIGYRAEMAKWSDALASNSKYWSLLAAKLPTVDAFSREQFIDRS